MVETRCIHSPLVAQMNGAGADTEEHRFTPFLAGSSGIILTPAWLFPGPRSLRSSFYVNSLYDLADHSINTDDS